MKRMKYILTSFVALLFMTGCNELDLAPEDYYGSGNYWKTGAQVEAAMQGLHLRARGYYWQLTQMGELRGGAFRVGASMVGTSLDAQQLISQGLSEDVTGISNWGGGMYYVIFPINLFISEVENGCPFLTKEQKDYYLGQAYGMRAFYYFMLYRTYGGVPLITKPDVTSATSAEQLYTARSTAEETFKLVKSDIEKSESYFGNAATSQKIYWTPNATRMLKADVYLWSAKVATGDHAAGGAADLRTAKAALEKLMSEDYSLLDKFGSIFDTKNKNNAEIIFAFRFLEGESTCDQMKYFISESRYFDNIFYTKEGKVMGDTLNVTTGGGLLRYVYKWGLFASMHEEDTRSAATFLPCYNYDATDTKKENLKPAGLIYRKTLGSINSSGNRIYDADWVIYRYADVLLKMAEIENGLGNASAAADYINQVRARAFGHKGDMAAFKAAYPDEEYVAGSFADNELAILHERDKEFVLEGTRWFDVVRLRGADGNSICFSPVSGYVDVEGGNVAPVLNYATQSHMLLWPINVGLLNQDILLTQTPGYETKYGDRNK